MLETVREYALERLEKSGELQRLRRRHASYFLELAEEEERASQGPLQREWLDRLETEHDNLRAALAWSLTSLGDTEMGLQLTGALSHFWYVREHHSESRMWLQSALERGSAATAARAKVLVGAGRLAWFQGELARANALLQESLVVFKDSGDSRGVAEVLLELGRVAHAQGNDTHALTLCRECLVLSRKLDNKSLIAFCLTTLAGVIQALGDAARAARLFEAAEILLQSLDAVLDPGGSLEYDSDLAAARIELGELAFEEARAKGQTMTFEQAVAYAFSESDTPGRPRP